MAMKSSKIAVTLEPSLKQKLREYGKENQIKNFSGVILAILDEHFGVSDASATSPADLWQVIRELTDRVDQLEGGTATTVTSKDKPKKVLKPKTSVKAAAAKPKVVKSASSSKPEKISKPVKKSAATKTTKPSTKSTATKAKTKAKSTRTTKTSSKSTPIKKSKTISTRKSSKAKATASNQWMSTREAFDLYGGNLSWSRFSKLTPEELKERFNLDSDLSRKVRGSRFNQWLTLGK